uniref:small multi-drug export protein n=1 Tax=Agathobacter sp. TaxID=2021311 RepID=UPI004056C055
MEVKKSKRFYLRWPWNLVVYVILVILLRILAVPVILLIMAWNKKQQPDGPEEGYCLQRTRRRLARLVWAALFLFIGIAVTAVFVFQVQADKSGWEIMDYVVLVISGGVGLGGIIAGLYEGYTDIRDALFPARSRLAKSIRSQLPSPDEGLDVRELFAMVDRDIQENGQWFDRVAVGREWVFGDDVTAISRIRAVFGRDEIIRRYVNGRTQRTRVIELYILDDRQQLQMTGLRNPSELESLLTCLKLRAPDALFLPYSQYLDYCGKSEDEWADLNREFRIRKGQRELEDFQPGGHFSQQVQNMVLTRGDGSATSRVSPEVL